MRIMSRSRRAAIALAVAALAVSGVAVAGAAHNAGTATHDASRTWGTPPPPQN